MGRQTLTAEQGRHLAEQLDAGQTVIDAAAVAGLSCDRVVYQKLRRSPESEFSQAVQPALDRQRAGRKARGPARGEATKAHPGNGAKPEPAAPSAEEPSTALEQAVLELAEKVEALEAKTRDDQELRRAQELTDERLTKIGQRLVALEAGAKAAHESAEESRNGTSYCLCHLQARAKALEESVATLTGRVDGLHAVCDESRGRTSDAAPLTRMQAHLEAMHVAGVEPSLEGVLRLLDHVRDEVTVTRWVGTANAVVAVVAKPVEEDLAS